MKNIKILFCILFLSIINFESFCQRIEKIDSSEVFILSLFRFENDTIETSDKYQWISQNKFPNTLQVYVLEADPNIQTNLHTGDNKYNFISLNDSIKIKYIESIIKNHAFANMFFLRSFSHIPISSIDKNLNIDNNDTNIINKYTHYRNNPISINYINEEYLTFNINKIDIIDGRLFNEFYNKKVGYDYYSNGDVHMSFKTCFFEERGFYYMLLRVNLIYVVIDDYNNEFLYMNKILDLGENNGKFNICDKYKMEIKYFEINNKKPIVIPLYLELLRPFNDKYRFYIDYRKLFSNETNDPLIIY